MPWLVGIPVTQNPPWYADLLAFAALVVLGTTVFVTYLRVADMVGYHKLEAFSAMRIEDYRSHLRLQVTADSITVHVLGIESVPAARRAADPTALIPEPHVVETLTVPWNSPRQLRRRPLRETGQMPDILRSAGHSGP